MTAVLGQCGKCQGYVLVEQGAVTVVVDVAPMSRPQYIESVLGGEGRWWVEKRPDGRLKLVPAPVGGPGPSWGASGLQAGAERFVHREHPCPAERARPLAPGAGGATPPKAHAGATGTGAASGLPVSSVQSVAPDVTPRLTDKAVRCGVCRKLIDQKTQPFTGLFHERWVWANHEVCA